MSLSIIVLCLIPIFLAPAVFLPRNKLYTYTGSLLIAIVPVLLFNLIEIFIPEIGIEAGIGEFFEWMFSWLVREEDLLTRAEALHIYAWFGYLVIFAFVFLIAQFILRTVYIGTNPSVHKPSRTLFHILISALFFILTYLSVSLFLTEIRMCFGFEDGFLTFVFEAIYPIGA